VADPGCAVKRNGNGNGHGDGGNGEGVSPEELPRPRAKYLTSSTPANDGADAGIVVISTALLVEMVRAAVSEGVARAVAQKPLPTLLTREALSKEIMVSESQVDKLRKAGMPWVRVGDSPRFRLMACVEWFEWFGGASGENDAE
jgi:hypothetical protein